MLRHSTVDHAPKLLTGLTGRMGRRGRTGRGSGRSIELNAKSFNYNISPMLFVAPAKRTSNTAGFADQKPAASFAAGS